MLSDEPMVIAIDGPSASGKSTVARQVAERLRFLYVDSGSFYRGITWKSIREGRTPGDATEVVPLLAELTIEFFKDKNTLSFTLDGEEPGIQLRSQLVRDQVARTAAIPEVRAFLVDTLRGLVCFGDLVMEGRDIGSVVFPDARYKFYLDADAEVRAQRRHMELLQRENPATWTKLGILFASVMSRIPRARRLLFKYR